MDENQARIVRMRDIQLDESLFRNYLTGTVLDELLCSYKGLPKGVNYMVIGDPGVGKTTIILDMLADIRLNNPGARVLFVSAEMNEIDLAVYVKRFPKFQDIDILFVESEFDEGCQTHNYHMLTGVLDQGWDIVAIDSFYELQGIVKEEENITQKKAESMLLSHQAAEQSSEQPQCQYHLPDDPASDQKRRIHRFEPSQARNYGDARVAAGEPEERLFGPLCSLLQAQKGRCRGETLL